MPPRSSITQSYEQLFGLLDGPVQTVRIRFNRDVAYLLKERRWHPTQTIKQARNGSILVTLQVGPTDELVAWILSWGADATILSPKELVRTVQSRLAAARRQYC